MLSNCQHRWFVTLVGLFATCAVLNVTSGAVRSLQAAERPAGLNALPPSVIEPVEARELAQRLDAHLAARWQSAHVEPAAPCDDAEFLRRVSLDLAGKIPSLSAAREFLNDPNPDKRAVLVDRLLSHASFAAHFANVWRGLLLPSVNNNAETRALVAPLESWLRLRFAEKAPYDRLVTEILTTRVESPQANVGLVAPSTAPTPAAFFFANERKPETLAASTSRLFLGVQLQCAECHDHPFADWKRDEFWSFAAFFREVALPPMAEGAEVPRVASADPTAGIEIPGTGRRVVAQFLRDRQTPTDASQNERVQLARWITAGNNPYFARATVNRLWAHFLGYGLIEPIDDVSAVNSPSHPEVLDALVSQFVAHQFDLSYLIRAIVATRAYQLSSCDISATGNDPRLFARMPLKTLSAEQLFDSLVEATGYRPAKPQANAAAVLNEGSARSQFVARFGVASERTAEGDSSILLALAMMNGDLVGAATSLEESETLTAIAEAPFFDTAARVEALFLATLSRRPTPGELQRFVGYVDAAGNKQRREPLADVFWALLNSSEFQLNH